MDESSFNMAVRKFLEEVGVTSQREIEGVVRDGKVEGVELKLRMTLTAKNAPLKHIVEQTIDLRKSTPRFAQQQKLGPMLALTREPSENSRACRKIARSKLHPSRPALSRRQILLLKPDFRINSITPTHVREHLPQRAGDAARELATPFHGLRVHDAAAGLQRRL